MKFTKAVVVFIAGAGLLLFSASAHAQMRGGGGFHGGSMGGFHGSPMGGFHGGPMGGFRGGPTAASHNGHFHDGHFHNGHFHDGHGHVFVSVGFGGGWWGYPYWYPYGYYYPPAYGYYPPPPGYYSQQGQVYNGRVVNNNNEGGK
jgi:hypothetical protein